MKDHFVWPTRGASPTLLTVSPTLRLPTVLPACADAKERRRKEAKDPRACLDASRPVRAPRTRTPSEGPHSARAARSCSTDPDFVERGRRAVRRGRPSLVLFSPRPSQRSRLLRVRSGSAAARDAQAKTCCGRKTGDCSSGLCESGRHVAHEEDEKRGRQHRTSRDAHARWSASRSPSQAVRTGKA